MFGSAVIGAAVGAITGIVGQAISDAVVSIATRKLSFSNWQSYVGEAVGGALGGAILGATGNTRLADVVSSGATTLVGQGLEKITSKNCNMTWSEIGRNSITDGVAGGILGESVKINQITTGRNSFEAVYKSGLTKLRNGTAKRMSIKTAFKGFVAGLHSDASYNLFSIFR